MELRDIEYFAVVAEHGNVRRASEVLELSPTAVSKSLRRLETSMQAKLFERTPKGVELTSVGTALLAQVQRIRLTLDDVAREAADLSHGRSGHLRVGTGPTVCQELSPAYATLSKVAPRITISVSVEDNDVMVPRLRNGEIDFIFNDYNTAYDGIIQEPLYGDELVVCASPNHPLAKLKRVTIGDLAKEQWTLSVANLKPQQFLLSSFREHGLSAPRVAVETRSIHVRLATIVSTHLLGYMSTRVLEDVAPRYRLIVLPVKELVWRRTIGVMYRKDGYLSPSARQLIDVLRRQTSKTTIANRK